MNKKIVLVFATIFIFKHLIAQENSFKLPSIAAGAGVVIFNGDIGKGNELSAYSKIRAGFNVSVEERIGKIIGFSVNGVFGKLADSERSKTNNFNFESKLTQGDLRVMFYTDELFPNANFTPYIGVGLGFLMFDPYSDQYDKDNNLYFYWSDGSIRNEIETTANSLTAKTLQRDYTYETKLIDTTNNYARNTLMLPISFGFTLKLLDNLQANLGATYNLTFSDYLDNIKSGGNDSYLYTNVTLRYRFVRSEKGPKEINKRYESVDFAKIDEADTDRDGVIDSKDNCAGTPPDVKVNSDGCPVDSDKDGVPDYLDKEVGTKKGSVVDVNGVTLTDEVLAAKQAKWDAAASERSETFNANPTELSIKEIERIAKEVRDQSANQKSLPVDFQPADYNQDGFIQVSEINQVIDGFFTGENDFTVEKINLLIDYFFEQ